jgi:acyl-CoA reductase-like NAD-dependent aldehyde dehydrogenase
MVPDFAAAPAEAADDRYGPAATAPTGDMAHAQEARRNLPVGTVEINNQFGGAPGERPSRVAPAAPAMASVPICSTR